MRKAQTWVFSALITCHLSLYAISDGLVTWNLARTDLWREVWWQVWGVTLAPALLAGYRFGLPVVEPIRIAIFLPTLAPNMLGYGLCLFFWCSVYGFLSYIAVPKALPAARAIHRRAVNQQSSYP